MIISKTPLRISFFGGGTDFPDWYLKYSGAVISTTIDKYCYISCRKLPSFFKHKYRIVYSKIELVNEISEIEHPSVREVLRYFGIKDGLEIHYDGDLPARSGLGSSSSFTVGLIEALNAYTNKSLPTQKVARLAIDIEREWIKEAGGCQDQVAAAVGGFNKICFNQDGSIIIYPMPISQSTKSVLVDGLALFYTGISRMAYKIERDKEKKINKNHKSLSNMHKMITRCEEILFNDFSLQKFGGLLHETWLQKKLLSSKVSNRYIDDIYKRALKVGAYGGKILGAGGGGFILFCIEPRLKAKLIKRLSPLLHVPFSLESQGSHIIHYS